MPNAQLADATGLPETPNDNPASRFRVLENLIAELGSMARITQTLLEHTLDDGSLYGANYIELKLPLDERDILLFAVQDVYSRSTTLNLAFQAACAGVDLP